MSQPGFITVFNTTVLPTELLVAERYVGTIPGATASRGPHIGEAEPGGPSYVMHSIDVSRSPALSTTAPLFGTNSKVRVNFPGVSLVWAVTLDTIEVPLVNNLQLYLFFPQGSGPPPMLCFEGQPILKQPTKL
jgi:hypothetical protein